MWALRFPLLLVLLATLIGGCSVKQPSIAHTHIGHAITGWQNTPDQMGLLLVAEKQAQVASEYARRAAVYGADIVAVKAEVSKVLSATNPQSSGTGGIKVEPPFGLKQALVGSIDHITFAANSEDATQNVRRFALQFAENSEAILDRCNLIEVLGEGISTSSSAEEVEILAQELSALAHANLHGIDSNGDGITGDKPEEYGIQQLRTSLDAALDREDPPYTTVSQWYLFNLIKLPTGKWEFKERPASAGGSY